MQVKTAKGFDWDLKGINVSKSSAAVHAPGSYRIALIQGQVNGIIIIFKARIIEMSKYKLKPSVASRVPVPSAVKSAINNSVGPVFSRAIANYSV